MTNTPVTQLEPAGNGFIVHTESASYHGDKVLLSAGAWNGTLLDSLGLSIPLKPTRKTVAWFGADEGQYSADGFPAFIFRLHDSMFYGFPSFDGAGVKIGRHDGGHAIDPDKLERTFGTYLSDEGCVRSFWKRICLEQQDHCAKARYASTL